MSDSYRQVGSDLPGSSTIAPEDCVRKFANTIKPEAVYEIEGKRGSLEAGMPANGTVFATILETDFYVVKSTLDDMGKGGAAKLTIYTEAAFVSATYGTADVIGEPQYSIKFQELRQKIEAHPCCGKLLGTSDLPSPTWDDWAMLGSGNWDTASEIPGWLDMEPWTLSYYQDKKRRGEDEFILYLPVITRTLGYTRDPGDIGKQSGRRSSPPVDSYAYISNYDWLCGPDEFNQRGNKYERTTSWMACEKVDAGVYSAAR